MEKTWRCKKCNTVIGGHNQYLHDGMCVNCFFATYFPETSAKNKVRKQ